MTAPLLVAPPDIERDDMPPNLLPWRPVPRHRLPFAAPVVTSSDDPFCAPERSAQMARDVITFLHWAANPEMVERKQMGWRWVLFFLVMTGLTYAVKRRVWAHVHWTDDRDADDRARHRRDRRVRHL